MASYPTPTTEFIPAQPDQFNFDDLQTAIERAEKFTYLTARLSIQELMQQDENGWTAQGTIDAWTKRLNDLPEESEE